VGVIDFFSDFSFSLISSLQSLSNVEAKFAGKRQQHKNTKHSSLETRLLQESSNLEEQKGSLFLRQVNGLMLQYFFILNGR
jgi:hypothetical protein